MMKKKIKKVLKKAIKPLKRRKKKMNITQNVLTVNGQEYVLKSSIQEPCLKAESKDGLEYKIIRGDRSGAFAGYLKSHNGKDAVILEARRIHTWYGAASLSQLAIDGTSRPKDCKFPEAVSKIQLTDVIEILDVTNKAKLSIASVAMWKV